MKATNTIPRCLDRYTTLNHRALAIIGCLMRAAQDGKPVPTHRDLCKATGCTSVNGVHFHLRRLKRLGLIDQGEKQAARTLRPTCNLLVPNGD